MNLHIEIPTIEDAIMLAAEMHKGQKDKCDEPYILHPIRVMLKMETEDERVVAVLHDIVEDCGITLDHLKSLGYSEEIVEAIGFLTKHKNEKGRYAAFIDRVCSGPAIAVKVKLADIEDNMDPRREPGYDSHYEDRMKRYAAARDILIEKLSSLRADPAKV